MRSPAAHNRMPKGRVGLIPTPTTTNTQKETEMVFDSRKTQEEVTIEGERILNKLVGIGIVLSIGCLLIAFM